MSAFSESIPSSPLSHWYVTASVKGGLHCYRNPRPYKVFIRSTIELLQSPLCWAWRTICRVKVN